MKKHFKLFQGIICLMLCLSLLLSFTGCKKTNNESESSEETEIVYEYIDETGDTSSDSSKPEDNKDIDKTSSVSSDNKNNAASSNTNTAKKVYKNGDELYEANPPVGSVITLDIEPYAKGEYKVVNGSYVANDVSIVYISTGKYAIRNVATLNAWVKDVPYGSFIAHQGFNGWINTADNTAPGTYPANTKEAIDHSVRLGYKMVEIDITITKDKVWVVDHDANSAATNATPSDEVKNFTNMLSGVIEKKNILRKWRTGGYWEFSSHIAKEKTPTLETVFKYMQNNKVYLVLDNKSLNHHEFTDEEYDILANLIKKYKMEKRCAVYAQCLEPISKRVNGVILAYSDIPSSNEEVAYKTMSSYGNFMLSVSKTNLSKYTAFAKKYNVPLAVWVEDEYYEADKLFANGANYILTNYCLPTNANLKDYKEIKAFSMADFTGNKTSGDFNAALTLNYKELGLRPGDIVVLSAECTKTGGEAFIRAGASDKLEAKAAINGKRTIYYIVNDSFESNIEVNFGVNGGSANFKNVKVSIMRESARGEK